MQKKYKPVEMEKLINEYLNIGLVIEQGVPTYIRPITISGLCDYLDIGRVQLEAYRNDKLYHNSIERAYRKILAYTEAQLFRNQGQVNGIIFNLKHNWKWSENDTLKIENKGIDLSGLSTNEIKELLKGKQQQEQQQELLEAEQEQQAELQ